MLRSLAMAALGVVGLIGAAAAAPADQDWSKVEAAAKKEGSLVLYNASTVPYLNTVVQNFQKKYGIAVQLLGVRASELNQRIQTEQAAGRFTADIEAHSLTTIREQRETTTYLQPIGQVPNAKNLRPPFKDDGWAVPAWIQAYGILVNTSAEKNPPKSWHDLLDPRFKGKILSDDMRPVGGGEVMFYVFEQKFGDDFNAKLAAQKPVFSRDLGNDPRRVARGEFAVYIPQMFAYAHDLQGLPVKAIVPEEGVPYVPIAFAMLRNAPHPNAARLFANYFLTPEVQEGYGNIWMPPVTDVMDKLTGDAKRFAEAKLLGEVDDYKKRNELTKRAKQLYP